MGFVSEQVAVPIDQLARFIGHSNAYTSGVVRSMEAAGWLERERFLVGDEEWVWMTRAGAKFSPSGEFLARKPHVKSLKHKRAINEVRLYLRERVASGRWLCERLAYQEMGDYKHFPDAVLEVNGERHAIEVELSRTRAHRQEEVIEEHSARYDLVVYFCGKETYRVVRALALSARWPKLVVRRVPKGGWDG